MRVAGHDGGGCLQVRSIELAGQGSKAVVYSARLVGHPDFGLEATTIRIEPGTPASFAVQCKASTTNPQVQASASSHVHAALCLVHAR